MRGNRFCVKSASPAPLPKTSRIISYDKKREGLCTKQYQGSLKSVSIVTISL